MLWEERMRRALRKQARAAIPPLLIAAALVVAPPEAHADGQRAEFDEQVLFRAGTGGYSCFRIPAIVEAADGTLLAFAEGRVKDCGDDGNIDVVLRRSPDSGRTWGPVEPVLRGTGDTRGNPAPVVDHRTGRVLLMTTFNPGDDDTQRHPFIQHSDDHGATWSPPRGLSDELRLPEWNSWYATGPGHGIQLERGPHAGRLVIGGNHEGDGGALQGAHLSYSDDGGETWRLGADDTRTNLTVKPQELSLAELDDGTIYAAARDQFGSDEGNRAFAESSDGGGSFDAPFETIRKLDAPVVQGAVLEFGDTRRERSRLLFSAPAHPLTRETMAIRSSYDDGRSWETWQRGKVVHWGPAAYSDMVELGPDSAALLYEAGAASPYEAIRFARFNRSWLDEPNGEPPGLPEPPAPGPITKDGARHRNHGYVRGGAQLSEGRFGAGIGLDGVDDFVEVPWSRSLDMAAGDFTWTAWIRYSATTGSHAIMWAYRVGQGTPGVWLRAEPASNRIRAFIETERGNAQVATRGAYNDGAWHFLALQRSSGRLSLSVDGQETVVTAAPAGSVTAGKELAIDGIHVGQRLDGVHRFRGSIDEVRVHTRALTAAQIRSIQDFNKPINSGLRLWLRLDRITPVGGEQ
jgi:BNR repeat-like domain/Concanavalin A-like lectin/glucanases superfamily